MFLFLIKKKRFLFSFLFLFTLLTFSAGNSIFNEGNIQQIRYIKDADGGIILAPPYPPFTVFLLGSDRFGFDLLHMMVEGAKYTIGLTLLITLLRMLLSLVVSYFAYSLKPFLYKTFQSLVEPFSIVPQTLLAFFILFSVLWMQVNGFAHSFFERAAFEVIILSVLAIPTLSMQLSNEIRAVHSEPFVEASKVLGGRKMHVFVKHIVPQLYERWILLFGQQFLQVLMLLAHLGVFKLFFGGTSVSFGLMSDPPRTLSYEWSGLIGDSLSYLFVQQWIAIVPISFFVLTAISVSFINDALKEMFLLTGNSAGNKASTKKRVYYSGKRKRTPSGTL
ncbi:ABC transporter permease subunit [Bacillus sp. F19]|nr:ABC transporter permease subunit [Bacillus sp. F19]